MPKLKFEICFKDGGVIVWRGEYDNIMRNFGSRIAWIEPFRKRR